jgi:hypothetical protein
LENHKTSIIKAALTAANGITLWNHIVGRVMVLLGRIELPTSSLPMTRSTTELQQPFSRAALCEATQAMSSNLLNDVAFGMAAV